VGFSSRVFATESLKKKRVTETIRSDLERAGLWVGQLVDIRLDGELLGRARIVSIDKVRLSEITREDAERGGFYGIVSEYHKALKRAGFRFRRSERQRNVPWNRFEGCNSLYG